MKLKNKLMLSYGVIAVFLVVTMTVAYLCCGLFCGMPHPLFPMNKSMQFFMASALSALILTFLFSLWFAGRISKPLKLLTVKTQDIANGHYEEKITTKTGTAELDSLIGSVNHLSTALDSQQRLKKQMARDYAHEFRTPLAALQSNLEGIIDGVFEPSNQRIESMRQEILRLSRMVSEIDKIVELENKSETLDKTQFDLCEVVKQGITTFGAELKEKNITVTVDTEPCMIYADRDKLSSVAVNLISNAVKYTDKNGRINIGVKSSTDTVTFSVLDNGIGISEGDISNIFEHLYRADTSRARDTGGCGIGLSVVKAIVTAHGGQILVNSEIGKGSEFIVTLPKELGYTQKAM